MAKIWTVNNKEEKKLLRRKLRDFDFSAFSANEIDKLVKDMDRSMQEADGVGLSANQVGLDMRVFVVRWEGKFYAVFNPKIEKKSKEKSEMEEMCLSVPEGYGKVERPEQVVLTGQNKRGKKIKVKAWGILARIFQHEIDHLDGKLFMDRMKRGTKLRFLK